MIFPESLSALCSAPHYCVNCWPTNPPPPFEPVVITELWYVRCILDYLDTLVKQGSKVTCFHVCNIAQYYMQYEV